MLLVLQRQSIDVNAIEDVVVVVFADGDVRRFAATTSVEVVKLVEVATFRPEEVIAEV